MGSLWFYIVLGICWIIFAVFIVWCMHSAEENRRADERFVKESRQVMVDRYFQEQ